MKTGRRRLFIALPVLLVLAGASAFVAARRGRLAPQGDELPLAVVRRGDIDMRVYATGELHASHSMMLTAPAVGGDSLQITQLTGTGKTVKKGDLIIEFDPTEQRYKLEQSHSELLQAEQEITKAKADATVLAAQDKVALLKARYAVRRAQLDVQKNELVSKIDADKNLLALEQAKRELAELQQDIQSHTQSGQAATYLAQQKYNKAKLEMDQAQGNLDKMRVVAPMDGLVSIQKNVNSTGGFFFTGMTLPDYHAGDQAQPGSAIAEIVDPQGMDLLCHVPEQDRENIRAGEPAEVVFDALPGRVFTGSVATVSGMTSRQFFGAPAGGGFPVTLHIAHLDPRLRSGLTARVTFLAGIRRNVLYLPRIAIFSKDGKHVVYVKDGGSFDQRAVRIVSESESRTVVDGLRQGDSVALVDPTLPRRNESDGTVGDGGTP
ncbi:MAG TPA: efflux RND transporter periplasmic adaptor subunit [Terracidiphilus sp.]|nr:efflux RND transporter periplasmic adaptor subunit [Terracidiphilus sp.]